MTFKITDIKNNEKFVKAESWLDLLYGLFIDVVKIERIEAEKAESEVEE